MSYMPLAMRGKNMNANGQSIKKARLKVKRRQPTTYAIGEKLIFTAPDGTEGECQVLFKGLVPGCLVVTFLNKEGRPTSHDGLTLPISQMRRV